MMYLKAGKDKLRTDIEIEQDNAYTQREGITEKLLIVMCTALAFMVENQYIDLLDTW